MHYLHVVPFNRKLLSLAMVGALGVFVSAPAFSETEIEGLKRELAEQRRMIEKLLAAQQEQKKQEEQKNQEAIQTGGPSRRSGLQTGVPTGIPPAGFTIYGVADVNYTNMDSGAGAKSTFGSGAMSSPRLGFKGEKALSDDLKAVFLMEAGVLFDTGSVGTGPIVPGIRNTTASSGGQTKDGTQFFSRQIYAGLKSEKFGALTVGRQYTGSYLVSASTAAAMGAGFFGTSTGFLPLIGGMPTRLNNSLVYASPTLRGLSAYLTVSTGNENNVNGNFAVDAKTTTTSQAGSGADLAIRYAHGPFNAAVTAWSIKNGSFVTDKETGLARRRGWQLAANYNVGPATLYGTYVSGRISGGNYENVTAKLSKGEGWSVSMAIPFGKSRVLASYTRLDDKSIQNKDGQLVGLAYTYAFLESTTLYGGWGKMLNNKQASYSLTDGGNLVGDVVTPGFKPSAYTLGINHIF